MFYAVLVSATLLAVSIGVIVAAIGQGVRNQEQINRQVCVAVNQFNTVIVDTLKRSRSNIPKLAYFKEHPDELKAQLRTIDKQIILFRQKPCGKEGK